MKHYLDLVPISARIHCKQNKMSIICIVLAVFLVTTIFGMADMFIRSQTIQARIDGGNYHIAIKDITDEQAALISKRPNIHAAARYGVINFRGNEGYSFKGKNAIIVGCDEEYMTELMVDIIDEGNFPKNNQEVMITRNAREYLGLQIGDTAVINKADGTELHYTISGFCNDAVKTMSEDSYGFFLTTTAFREIYPVQKSNSLADYNSILCVQFSNLHDIQDAISTLKEECNLSNEQISENTKLLGLLGQSSSSFMVQVYTAAIILFILVMTAGVIMITSSLNSNIMQRTEFFGLMRCIGATPKQVMTFVNKEALNWCYFAIPIGVITGIVVIWGLCAILRELSPEYFGSIPMFSLSMPSVIAGIVIGLLTVLLAARSPAKKAAKVSPLIAASGNAINLRPIQKEGMKKSL